MLEIDKCLYLLECQLLHQWIRANYMIAKPFDFQALLDPVTITGFLAEYWEQRHLLIQGRSDTYYHGLISIEDIDRLISRTDSRYPDIRLAKNGVFYPKASFTRDIRYGDEAFEGVPDVEKIFTEYCGGATVTLPALHRQFEPIGQLCGNIETQFDHVVNANAYITPARAAGFTPHYDTHEVFVLQIAGRKHWSVFPPPIALPHKTQIFSPNTYIPSDKPMLEVELTAGDLLYLPRGYVHTTNTSESFSAHVTIGITVYTWVELLSELLQTSVENSQFRQALPLGFASRLELRDKLETKLCELVDNLCETADFAQLINVFAQRVRSAHPRRSAKFHTDMSAIGLTTLLEVIPRHGYEISIENDGLIVSVEGRRVRLPSAAKPIVDAMCSSGRFVPERLAGHYGNETKLALAQYLYGIGFLKTVS